MLKVGLTGGIGSGKSYVAEIFKKLGIPVYNADERAKSLMTDVGLRKKIMEVFGKEAYDGNKLNRKYISSIVFSNKEKLKELNSIVHPAVRKDYTKWHSAQNAPYTIREAAILFESGAYNDCNKIIAVNCPEKIRIGRVMERDGVDENSVRSRMNNQWTDEERTAKSDFIILNDGTDYIEEEVNRIHNELLKLI